MKNSVIKFTFISLFPKEIQKVLHHSIVQKAIEKKQIELNYIQLRDFGLGKNKQVDDTQYGPGKGMVLMIEPLMMAIQYAKKKLREKPLIILLTPQGQRWTQTIAQDLIQNHKNFLFICGNYEGYDERIRDFVDLEISIGDFVLTGGEIAAVVIANTLIRLCTGIIQTESIKSESFMQNRLDYPVYTKPLNFQGKKVPDILLSGHHQKIQDWRKKKAFYKTLSRRPDLIKIHSLTPQEQKWFANWKHKSQNSFKT